MTTIDTSNQEFEVAKRITEILDPLTIDRQKQVMALLNAKGREFDIASQVTELLNTLRPEHHSQLMAFLGKRYNPWAPRAKSPSKGKYKPAPKKRY